MVFHVEINWIPISYQEETKKSCGLQTKCRNQALMLVEENIEVYLYDIGIGNDSLNKMYKIEVIKKKYFIFLTLNIKFV